MKHAMKYLNDEHMRLYEWSGLSTEMGSPRPVKSKRTHSWHASYSVLAVLTTLLILNGCDRQATAEQASDQVGQAVQEPPAQPLYDDPTAQAPADAAAPATEGTGEPPADDMSGTSGPVAGDAGQAGAAPQQP